MCPHISFAKEANGTEGADFFYFLEDASPYLLSNFCKRDGERKEAKMHSHKSSVKNKHRGPKKSVKKEEMSAAIQKCTDSRHRIFWQEETDCDCHGLESGKRQRKRTDHEGISGVDNGRAATEGLTHFTSATVSLTVSSPVAI